MIGYTLIYFVVAFLMAIAAGTMLYCSWRYVGKQQAAHRMLWFALGSGFIFWYFGALILALTMESGREFAVRWFGGNGFYFATIIAMMGLLIHYQLLSFCAKK